MFPQIETIDASRVDTSFVGHCDYGDNRSVLSDIFLLVARRLAGQQTVRNAPSVRAESALLVFCPVKQQVICPRSDLPFGNPSYLEPYCRRALSSQFQPFINRETSSLSSQSAR